MRLLVINQFASTPKYSSGAGERFYYLAEEFKKLGIETQVLSGGFNHLFLKYPSTNQLFNTEQTPGATFFWVRMKKYHAKSNVGRIFSFFEFVIKLFLFPIKKRGKPDLVLVSSMSIFPVLYAFYLKWRFKIPFVLEIRDIWPLTPVELGGFSKKHPFIRLLDYLAKTAYRRADHIVSVLPGFNRFLTELGIQKPFTWIPNGISVNLEITQSSQKKEKENFILGYAGAIGTANAMEFLVEATRQLEEYEDISIWIIGDGPEKEKLMKLSKPLKNLHFHNKVSKNEIQALLGQVDCCYIGWRNRKIYDYGVSANKYNDYMLAGKPIISSSNIPEDPVLLANCGIQVPPEDPQALAEGIMRMVKTNKVQRDLWGRNGAIFVKTHNLYRNLATKYVEIFEQVGITKSGKSKTVPNS